MNVLSKLREELLHYDKHRMWDSILEEIDRHTSSAGLTVKEGAKIENSDLNRYRNILPYDQTRVVLPESGYINANYVTLNGTDLDLILTQGPLLGTVGDFWKMVWNEHCENIIMLSGFVEGNRVMCHPYLPMNLNSGQYDTLSTETFEVKLVDVVRHEHFEVRKLVLRCKMVGFFSTRLHSLLLMLFFAFCSIRKEKSVTTICPVGPTLTCQRLQTNFWHCSLKQEATGRKGPTVVHCSAGVGRSGSFAVIYGCIKMMVAQKDLTVLDLPRVISDLRRCRMKLIQTPQQLRFCWDALISAASCLQWRCAFGIADPSTSSNGAASEAVSSSAVDQSSKEDSKLYSLASNTGVRNGPTESDGFCWRRYDERYMDRVRRRKMEAEKMRTRLMAMKEKMNREQDDRLFYYILFFLVVFALFVAFCLMLKPK